MSSERAASVRSFLSRAFALAALLLLALAPLACGQPRETQNVILITVDGVRWQEVFGGADSLLIRDERYSPNSDRLIDRFWAPTSIERRERLMPFIWEIIASRGQLYGNRRVGSRVDVTNTRLFSYPGYNEILVGRADDRIDSNDKRPNPNQTVLEFLNEREEFRGRVAAFGSWDVFPYIINTERSGIPVNAGFETVSDNDLTDRERFLNELQAQIPSPWETVRLDAFTHHFAKEALKRKRPRLLYIAYGEPDDFAHDAEYDSYLTSTHRVDQFIRDLWDWVQATEGYRDRTTFVITTDHGRGEGGDWTRHGEGVAGAGQIWLAVIGPDSPPLGEVKTSDTHFQNQVAATVAELLGVRYESDGETGEAVAPVLGR